MELYKKLKGHPSAALVKDGVIRLDYVNGFELHYEGEPYYTEVVDALGIEHKEIADDWRDAGAGILEALSLFEEEIIEAITEGEIELVK